MIEKKHFGYTKNNIEIVEYRITNKKGNYIDVINYGARIRNLCVADRNGQLVDVCLGYDSVKEYEEDIFYLGASVGRYANRIEKGEFVLNGKSILCHRTKRISRIIYMADMKVFQIKYGT